MTPSKAPADPYVYVIVRADLTLPQQIVQACHAVLQAAYRYPLPQDTSPIVPFIVVLQTPDKATLVNARERLLGKNIDMTLFYEPDDNLGATALASEPIYSKQKRKAFFIYTPWDFELPVPAKSGEVYKRAKRGIKIG